MQSLADTVASGAELTIDLAPGVFAEHIFDRPAVQRGSQMVVPFGAFAGTDRKTLLVRLRVPRGAAGERPVASVRLHYNDLSEGSAGDCEGELLAQLSDDSSAIATLDGLVSARVSASETAETLEEANALFNAGQADEAQKILDTKREALRHKRAGAVSVSGPRAAEAERSFAKQDAVLSEAGGGFAQPPAPATVPTTGGESRPAAPPPAADKVGKKQVRDNQQDAFDLSE